MSQMEFVSYMSGGDEVMWNDFIGSWKRPWIAEVEREVDLDWVIGN